MKKQITVAFGLFVLSASLFAPCAALAARGAVAAAKSAETRISARTGVNTIEQAASNASETGRKVAISLIGLGFAFAAVVLAFKRDFKEAVAVFAIGVVAVLFAQQSGINLIQNLVHSLVG